MKHSLEESFITPIKSNCKKRKEDYTVNEEVIQSKNQSQSRDYKEKLSFSSSLDEHLNKNNCHFCFLVKPNITHEKLHDSLFFSLQGYEALVSGIIFGDNSRGYYINKKDLSEVSTIKNLLNVPVAYTNLWYIKNNNIEEEDDTPTTEKLQISHKLYFDWIARAKAYGFSEWKGRKVIEEEKIEEDEEDWDDGEEDDEEESEEEELLKWWENPQTLIESKRLYINENKRGHVKYGDQFGLHFCSMIKKRISKGDMYDIVFPEDPATLYNDFIIENIRTIYYTFEFNITFNSPFGCNEEEKIYLEEEMDTKGKEERGKVQDMYLRIEYCSGCADANTGGWGVVRDRSSNDIVAIIQDGAGDTQQLITVVSLPHHEWCERGIHPIVRKRLEECKNFDDFYLSCIFALDSCLERLIGLALHFTYKTNQASNMQLPDHIPVNFQVQLVKHSLLGWKPQDEYNPIFIVLKKNDELLNYICSFIPAYVPFPSVGPLHTHAYNGDYSGITTKISNSTTKESLLDTTTNNSIGILFYIRENDKGRLIFRDGIRRGTYHYRNCLTDIEWQQDEDSSSKIAKLSFKEFPFQKSDANIIMKCVCRLIDSTKGGHIAEITGSLFICINGREKEDDNELKYSFVLKKDKPTKDPFDIFPYYLKFKTQNVYY